MNKGSWSIAVGPVVISGDQNGKVTANVNLTDMEDFPGLAETLSITGMDVKVCAGMIHAESLPEPGA